MASRKRSALRNCSKGARKNKSIAFAPRFGSDWVGPEGEKPQAYPGYVEECAWHDVQNGEDLRTLTEGTWHRRDKGVGLDYQVRGNCSDGNSREGMSGGSHRCGICRERK